VRETSAQRRRAVRYPRLAPLNHHHAVAGRNQAHASGAVDDGAQHAAAVAVEFFAAQHAHGGKRLGWVRQRGQQSAHDEGLPRLAHRDGHGRGVGGRGVVLVRVSA
jgi:hypothetical protein